MLTALAAAGFDELAVNRESDHRPPSSMQVAVSGNACVAFGLTDSGLFDLMFSPDALQRQDPRLQRTQERALAPLLQATSPAVGPPLDALTRWALVHGLGALIREGACRWRKKTRVRSRRTSFTGSRRPSAASAAWPSHES